MGIRNKLTSQDECLLRIKLLTEATPLQNLRAPSDLPESVGR